MERRMDAEALTAFLAAEFPQVATDYTLLEVAPPRLIVQIDARADHLRPGGTVSGPTLFALADVGFYLAILSVLGPEALAVTTNASIDFMRKPRAGATIIGEARILKLGRRLAVGDVMIREAGDAEGAAPLARASLTYALPPAGGG